MINLAGDLRLRDGEERHVGRPRKWASEAERKRAYRERLAAALENPLALRRDLRTERRRTTALKQQNDRLARKLADVERRAERGEDLRRETQERIDWLNEVADRNRQQLIEALAKVAELEAEIDTLRRSDGGTRPVPRTPPTTERPHADGPRPVPVALVHLCFAKGCPNLATCRVQGPRGVERDACEAHARPGRKPGRWRVVRRYR